jgi:hypothetical protein
MQTCNKLKGSFTCIQKHMNLFSKVSFFQVREQEFDVNFWTKSLNSLTWVEILRQVLVASGFGSKQHMDRDFFNKVSWTPQCSKLFNQMLTVNFLYYAQAIKN